jgi:hypothetical protein
MGSAAPARLKVHRRSFVVDRRRCTALTLRPTTSQRFATNYFHATWHVLSDRGGARLLGRLCWAMAHSRHEGTFVLIDPRFVVPNPFDADPSSPIVVVNSDISRFGRPVAQELRRRLPCAARSEGTVVLQTNGLDVALDDVDAFWDVDGSARSGRPAHQDRRFISRVNGLVVMAAPSPVLKDWAVSSLRLGERFYRGSDYTELDGKPGEWRSGEVQIFADFTAMVSRARTAREQLFPGRSHEELTDDERAQVWYQPARAG